MAPPTYAKQLADAREALAAIVSGQLASHSTLAGSYQHLSVNDLQKHIEWLEVKASQERTGRRGYVALAQMSGGTQ
jgi:hypothetical protein